MITFCAKNETNRSLNCGEVSTQGVGNPVCVGQLGQAKWMPLGCGSISQLSSLRFWGMTGNMILCFTHPTEKRSLLVTLWGAVGLRSALGVTHSRLALTRVTWTNPLVANEKTRIGRSLHLRALNICRKTTASRKRGKKRKTRRPVAQTHPKPSASTAEF